VGHCKEDWTKITVYQRQSPTVTNNIQYLFTDKKYKYKNIVVRGCQVQCNVETNPAPRLLPLSQQLMPKYIQLVTEVDQ